MKHHEPLSFQWQHWYVFDAGTKAPLHLVATRRRPEQLLPLARSLRLPPQTGCCQWKPGWRWRPAWMGNDEDAGGCEGRGLLAARICSARYSRSPCRLAPTRCCAAATSMDGKDEAFLLCNARRPGFVVGASDSRC